MATSVPSSHNEADRHRGWFPRRPRSPLEHGQLVLLLALFFLTVGAWALTIHQSQTMHMPMGVVPRAVTEISDATTPPAGDMDDMPNVGATAMDDAADMAATGMTGAGWSVAAFASFLVAWAVMMAAMMFPAAAPMLLLFRTMTTQRQAGTGGFAPTWVCAAGYLLVWTVVGALTWLLVQVLSDVAGRLEVTERAAWAPIAMGAVLIGAGLYQVTPLKQVCLDHCRSPLAFVMQHWRSGYGGALQMGIIHGLYCLGCCWALFAVLVAAGIMSLAWMLLLTLVVFAEKVLLGGQRTSQVVGCVFVVWGLGVAGGVVDVPWVV
jgi:predicted metal-binding membrane protein